MYTVLPPQAQDYLCQLNVAQQLLISEEHLSHFGAPLLWAILVDFYQVSNSSSPAGAEAADRMLPVWDLNITGVTVLELSGRHQDAGSCIVRSGCELLDQMAAQQFNWIYRLKWHTWNWIYTFWRLFLVESKSVKVKSSQSVCFKVCFNCNADTLIAAEDNFAVDPRMIPEILI